MSTKTLYTLADYLALEEPDGPRFELSEGELIMTPSPTWEHNDVRDQLRDATRRYLRQTGRGVVTAETDFLLSPATVRRPDVAVVLSARMRPEYRRTIPVPIAPDIVLEVVSKEDRPGARKKLARQYLETGVKAVWLIDPHRSEARRHVGGGIEAEAHARIEEPQWLPGFSVGLDELLAEEE